MPSSPHASFGGREKASINRRIDPVILMQHRRRAARGKLRVGAVDFVWRPDAE